MGICYRYVGQRQIAKDLAHDAFLIAIDKSADFKGSGTFEGWLRRITINVALQYLRQQKNARTAKAWATDLIELPDSEEESLANRAYEWSPYDFSQEELLEAIQQLPQHHRMVFNLYVIDRFTHAEIGQQLGISAGTSKSHLARARKKIKTVLLARKTKKKRSLLLLFLPGKLWNIEAFCRKSFADFEMPLEGLPQSDSVDFSSFATPKFKSADFTIGRMTNASVTAGQKLVLGGIAASFLVLIAFYNHSLDFPPNAVEHKLSNQTAEPVAEITPHTSSLANNPNTSQPTTLSNLNAESATIPDSSILVNENIPKLTTMKKLSTLGVATLLLTQSTTAVDSTFMRDFKREIRIETLQNQVRTEPRSDAETTGTFTASKIVWSAKDHKVYFVGNKVKVDFGKNHFFGDGTFTFLDPVYYLVIEGQPVTLDSTTKLSDEAYELRQLSPEKAMSKYGEKGKNGAVEISKD